MFKGSKLTLLRFKVNVKRFKVNVKRFKVTHAAAWGQNLSVSVHSHHVVGISINYCRGEAWRFATDNWPPPLLLRHHLRPPTQNEGNLAYNKACYVPPLQPVEGKGRRPQPTASQGTNCHSPIPSATAKKSWYVLALRCTIKRRRCCDDVVAATAAAAAAAATSHDGQQRERAKPAIPTFVLPQSCGNLTVHIV